MELDRSPANLDDDIRMLKNIGAKFVGRTIYLWGDEARIADPKFLAAGKDLAERIHQNDPDVVLQAAVFEIVTEAVGQVPVPDWVFQEFGQLRETRNFDYSKMLFPDGSTSIIGGGDRRCPTSARWKPRCGSSSWRRPI